MACRAALEDQVHEIRPAGRSRDPQIKRPGMQGRRAPAQNNNTQPAKIVNLVAGQATHFFSSAPAVAGLCGFMQEGEERDGMVYRPIRQTESHW